MQGGSAGRLPVILRPGAVGAQGLPKETLALPDGNRA